MDMGARWISAVVAGAAVGAIAVGVVAATQDSSRPTTAEATTPTTSIPAQDDGTSPPAGVVTARAVTVQGQGSAAARPDTAAVHLGVHVEAATANEALDQANSEAEALLAALAAQGVAEDDIATGSISLYPVYDDDYLDIVAYSADNSVSVTLRDLDTAGATIDAVAGLVGDELTIAGISFYVDDTDAVLSEARVDAISDAAGRAEDYASAAGVTVGEVQIITELSHDVPIELARDASEASPESVDSVPLQPGMQEFTVTVTVVYALS